MATEIVSEDQPKPRVWNYGDVEPTDCGQVRDCQNDVWTLRVIQGEELWTSPETAYSTWCHITKKWGPLTEVVTCGAEMSASTPRVGDTVRFAVSGQSDDVTGVITAIAPCQATTDPVATIVYSDGKEAHQHLRFLTVVAVA